jgi:hypothetical protein
METIAVLLGCMVAQANLAASVAPLLGALSWQGAHLIFARNVKIPVRNSSQLLSNFDYLEAEQA